MEVHEGREPSEARRFGVSPQLMGSLGRETPSIPLLGLPQFTARILASSGDIHNQSRRWQALLAPNLSLELAHYDPEHQNSRLAKTGQDEYPPLILPTAA